MTLSWKTYSGCAVQVSAIIAVDMGLFKSLTTIFTNVAEGSLERYKEAMDAMGFSGLKCRPALISREW